MCSILNLENKLEPLNKINMKNLIVINPRILAKARQFGIPTDQLEKAVKTKEGEIEDFLNLIQKIENLKNVLHQISNKDDRFIKKIEKQINRRCLEAAMLAYDFENTKKVLLLAPECSTSEYNIFLRLITLTNTKKQRRELLNVCPFTEGAVSNLCDYVAIVMLN